MKNPIKDLSQLVIGFIIVLLILFAIYSWIAVEAFKFRHRDMSETERFYHFDDALFWR